MYPCGTPAMISSQDLYEFSMSVLFFCESAEKPYALGFAIKKLV